MFQKNLRKSYQSQVAKQLQREKNLAQLYYNKQKYKNLEQVAAFKQDYWTQKYIMWASELQHHNEYTHIYPYQTKSWLQSDCKFVPR